MWIPEEEGLPLDPFISNFSYCWLSLYVYLSRPFGLSVFTYSFQFQFLSLEYVIPTPTAITILTPTNNLYPPLFE